MEIQDKKQGKIEHERLVKLIGRAKKEADKFVKKNKKEKVDQEFVGFE